MSNQSPADAPSSASSTLNTSSTSSNSITPEQKTAQDLVTIIPNKHHLNLGGVEFDLRPIKMGDLPVVLTAVAPLKNMLTLKTDLDIAALFLLHADECLTLLSALSRQPRRVVDDLALDDGAVLLARLIEINADFFTKKVLPSLTSALVSIKSEIVGNT